MDIIEAISSRRSIRTFTGAPVSAEDLKSVLQAGFQAPSAHNFQPREYIVVKKPETLAGIAQVHPFAKMLPQAGLGIIVCGDKNKQRREGLMIADCAAAIQNMLLAAHGIGLGAVWCGLYPIQRLIKPIVEICRLPEELVPVGLVVLGQKAERKEPIDRFDQTKVHEEIWSRI